MFGKLITALTTTALFMCATAGLSGLASADDSTAPEADLARGEQLFALCTQCHATDGGGDSKFLAPAIAGLPAWYVDIQLKNFKSGMRGLHPDDRGGLRMYPMSLWLRSDTDREAVSAYIASLPPTDPPRELDHAGDTAKGQGTAATLSTPRYGFIPRLCGSMVSGRRMAL